jgi:hypothetical protein
LGNTPQLKTTVFLGYDGIKPGDPVMVRVESATAHSLVGLM